MSDDARLLLEEGLGHPLPPRLAEVVRPGLDASGLEAFEASLVLPLDGSAARVAASDRGDASAWERALLRGWSHATLARFVRLVPGARRMVDTDGTDRAEVFLDDLHEHGLTERGFPVMCLVLSLPSLEIVRITRHLTPPVGLVSGAAGTALTELVARGASGVWGVRWSASGPDGFVWVSESRWKRDAERTRAIAERYALPAAWARVRALAEARGLAVYPDAMDHRAGRFDLTVGVMRR